MERSRLILVSLLALGAAASAAASDAAPPGGRPQSVSRRVSVRFESGRTVRADVVDTPVSRETGLMYRKRLPRDYGMLFVFPGEYGMQFWMKNTWVSLDMVFIGKDKRVTAVHERVKPSTPRTTDAEVARAGGLAQFVLELPAGAAGRCKVKAGQSVDFDVPIPER